MTNWSDSPEIPTAAEQGYPGYMVEGWIAVVGPKGLSAEQIKALQARKGT